MFFRMLKSDLRHNRALNVILFLFITIASALVLIGAAQVYSALTGSARTKKLCRNADAVIRTICLADSTEQHIKDVSEILDANPNITGYSAYETVQPATEGVDFEHYDEQNSTVFQNRIFRLSKQWFGHNLVFDTYDRPFYVPNGKIAVPVSVQELTGAKIGETVRITTDLGKVYEFEICCFFKTPERSVCIISDADYEQIAPEFARRRMFFLLDYPGVVYADLHTLITDIYNTNTYAAGGTIFREDDTADRTIALIVSVFVVLISIFLILLVLMTVRFTIIASLKEEEKEIGIMRAIGVESLKFRWLFAAKYIAFAAVGGVLGAIIGFPLSRKVVLMFGCGALNPSGSTMLLISICAVSGMILVMMLFSVFVMRRIRRISIIDAIHGENRGERFRRSMLLHLHRCRRMPVPLYLAAADILSRLKRYVFLLITYILGVCIVLLTVFLRHSVMNPDFLRYSIITDMDFYPDFTDEARKPYDERADYDGIPFYELLNAELKAAGIPAHCELYNSDIAMLCKDSNALRQYQFCYDIAYPEKLVYRPGGQPPKLANEIALSWHTAKQLGIRIGDTVEMECKSMDFIDGALQESTKRIPFVVTGFIDQMEAGWPQAVAGSEYRHADDSQYRYKWIGFCIDSDDKEGVFRQIVDRWGRENILTADEMVKLESEQFDRVLTLLVYVMGGMVLLVTVLITVLYLNIFIAEDTPEIALLRSIGFSGSTVFLWQLLRIVILAASAILIAILLFRTAGSMLAAFLFEQIVDLTGFRFLPFPQFLWGLMPLMMLTAVLLPTVLRLRHIGQTDLRLLNEE
ncbi:MAG: ABC transporter permease [Oscillospiraceae bacterium]|nr:ABC transporter permease [Oscillospiraceae bacterium]